jgi:ubiquinol-cytochrome c reductase iron-sulfur subunit
VTAVRNRLRLAVRYLSIAAGLAMLFVLLDFAIDIRPPAIQEAYRLQVGELAADEARILRRDNLAILVIRRSADTIERLSRPQPGLQDPSSRRSSQPGYATNSLRSAVPEYFVGYAIGTDFGCALEILADRVREICGDASYDFAGRALAGAREFKNLPVPDYNFSDDYLYLTVRP